MARTTRPVIARPPAEDLGQKQPYTDGSISQPILDFAATTWASQRRDLGSYGLRQFSGWVREEFLPQLRGRQLWTTYREMLDNNAAVGAIVHAITQAMRSVRWRDVPANDSAKAKKMADFAASLRDDCSHTWDDFVAESLTMLGYGVSVHELVWKRRTGHWKAADTWTDPASKYDDNMIGFRRLPIRGQDTIWRWYFDDNGQITGMQQQPYTGNLIDLPVEKLLIFRPTAHKNNPEGKSILRSAYRAHYFIKRLEEMESILFERLSGIPVVKIPNQIILAAQSGTDKNATAAYQAFQKMVTNVRINEQMGLVLPSDMWSGANGPTGHPMYEFSLVTPQSGHVVDPNPLIQRYKLDILKSVLADFIDLGHQARGTQNLAITKMDMFYKSIEGWLHAMAAVYNRYGVGRCWRLNGLDEDLMPMCEPDMASRLDLDQLGNFVLHLFQAGIPMGGDEEAINYLRHQAGLPELDEGTDLRELNAPAPAPGPGDQPGDTPATRSANALIRVAARQAFRRIEKEARKPTITTAAPFLRPIVKDGPAPPLKNGHDRGTELLGSLV